MANGPEPLRAMWRATHGKRRRTLHVGIDASGLVRTRPSTHLLTIAIARSDPGKSTSIINPGLFSYFGPVLAASNKNDNYEATALVRSAFGTVWHYRPDGEDL